MAARTGVSRKTRPIHWAILVSGVTFIGVAMWLILDGSPATDQAESNPQQSRFRQELLTPENPLSVARPADSAPVSRVAIPPENSPAKSSPATPPPGLDADDTERWQTEHIRPGDSFATVMKRLGYSPAVVARVINSGPHAKQLVHLKPGHQLKLLDQEDNLEKVIYEIDQRTRLDIDLATTPPTALVVDLPVEIRMRHANGDINSSLYMAAKSAGLGDTLIMELANIFGWDVDFTLDLRKGDHFTVVYSELYLDGEKVDNGEIFAAELTANGRQIQAVRYEDEAGQADYYTPQGKSMRKAFSRNPLPITRITSRFNPNRLHPIFKTRRPHRGVDYGAKSGTPVRATGDGKVIFRGKKGGYGNTVIIQHGQRYSTLYAHLKSFARSIKTGSVVSQGKTIAYVGQSGWATGPHLHYEFRVNGVHKNPLTVKLPPAKPVRPSEKTRFKTQTAAYLEQLNRLSGPRLASRGTQPATP